MEALNWPNKQVPPQALLGQRFRIISGCLGELVGPSVDDGVAIDIVDTGHDALLELVLRCNPDVAQDRAGELGEEALDEVEPVRALLLTLPYLSEARRRPEQTLWQEFNLRRPRLMGALLDAVSHGLRALPQVRRDRLPRMADFALWAKACETALWPAGTFAQAYAANRMAAIEAAIDADPVAACVRDLMAERSSWAGSAADLLRAGADRSSDVTVIGTGWPKNPRAFAGRLRRAHAFAGRLRRAQTALRTLGIEIAFTREGHAGSRVIRIHNMLANTGSSLRREGAPPQPRDGVPADTYRPDVVEVF
jgi:hypothetical protein